MNLCSQCSERVAALLEQAVREEDRSGKLHIRWFADPLVSTARATDMGAMHACVRILQAMQCREDVLEEIADIIGSVAEFNEEEWGEVL